MTTFQNLVQRKLVRVETNERTVDMKCNRCTFQICHSSADLNYWKDSQQKMVVHFCQQHSHEL